MTDLLISQLADRTGVPATTLRFYEGAGLLPAGRTPGGYRVYDEPIPDGIKLTMPSDRATRVAELASAEQQCCPFLDFRLHLAGQQMHLEVRAPAEAATMLTSLLAPAS